MNKPISSVVADHGVNGLRPVKKRPKRGRPERSPEEAARRALARNRFGAIMKDLREAAGLTILEASELSGLHPSRKISQYETTCYPPGDVVRALAPHYNVDPAWLAGLVLSHSDPALYECLTGNPGHEPSSALIDAYMRGDA